jgi:putative transposase
VPYGAIYLNDRGRGKPFIRFNQWSKSAVINLIFNRLLYGLVDWSATAMDGSNIRALKCAAGAQKNIPI